MLIGDVAHAIHPLAEQGVKTGLRDVQCLVSILRNQCDPGAGRLLGGYTKERRLTVKTVQPVCDMLCHFFLYRFHLESIG